MHTPTIKLLSHRFLCSILGHNFVDRDGDALVICTRCYVLRLASSTKVLRPADRSTIIARHFPTIGGRKGPSV
jgi:hypothetical protein